jgi:hypothetical protein
MNHALTRYITQQGETQDIQRAAFQIACDLMLNTSQHDSQVNTILTSSHQLDPRLHFPLLFESLGATIRYKSHQNSHSNASHVCSLTLSINFSDTQET